MIGRYGGEGRPYAQQSEVSRRATSLSTLSPATFGTTVPGGPSVPDCRSKRRGGAGQTCRGTIENAGRNARMGRSLAGDPEHRSSPHRTTPAAPWPEHAWRSIACSPNCRQTLAV